MKTIVFDIDGVLNNYPACWLDFIELHKKEKYTSIDEAKKKLGHETYSDIKHQYRVSGFKSKLPINPLAPSITKSLKEKGYTIVIATSRPFHLYPHLEKLTFDWLKANGITFDFLERKGEHLIAKYNPIFHIDDELEHVHFLLEKKINVLILKRDDINYDGAEKYESLRFVKSLDDVLAYIE